MRVFWKRDAFLPLPNFYGIYLYMNAVVLFFAAASTVLLVLCVAEEVVAGWPEPQGRVDGAARAAALGNECQ